MAREHARILCSIWSPGDDFRNRSPLAQRMYFLVISQREINNAGVIPLMVSKWARCSAHTTPADVELAIAELEEHRYFVVDRETDELLVRTFIRGDGVLKQPNVLKSALRLARQIESQALRVALAQELLRSGHTEAVRTASEIAPEAVPNPWGNPSGNPSPNPSPTPERNPSHGPERNPSPSPAGWGGGRGRGNVPSEGGSGGGDARDATPPPAPAPLDPANPRCVRHRNVPADDPGPDCRTCREVRLAVEAEEQRALDERASRDDPAAAWRAAVDACPDCDENGKFERPDGSLIRHHPLTEAAAQAAPAHS